MYDYLRGKVTKIGNDSLTLEVNGVGWHLFVPLSVLRNPPEPASTCTFFTSFVIREFSQALYGFTKEAERDLFEALLNINGIGPKTALAICGHLSFEELQDALFRKDEKTLCRVPGIGKKTAERLLVDLKNILPEISSFAIQQAPCGKVGFVPDAISALVNLGYNQFTAQRAVKKAIEQEEAKDLSSLITLSLRQV
jgi:holliday junction DNA helicase RuvA